MSHLQSVKSTLQPDNNNYNQLTTYTDTHNRISWGYMHASPRPCFTPAILRELLSWGGEMVNMIDDPDKPDIDYFVLASNVPEIFSLGGDLDLFMRHIESRDRDALYRYAIACIDCSYTTHSHLNRPNVTSIALVQGQALGGGFESALAANILIAERGCKMGLPEILFNLFPGMGAMTFLGRRVGHQKAEKIILSGKLFLAEELYEMGAIDILAEPGEGESTVYEYIRKENKSRNGSLALRAAREISQPAPYDELIRITEIWVDAALRLTSKDLKMMERLVSRQTGKSSQETSSHPQSVPLAS